jgi:hypothetical protein
VLFCLCLVPIHKGLGYVRHAGDCFVLVHRWFGYCWPAVIAGNEINLNHRWGIANKKCQ